MSQVKVLKALENLGFREPDAQVYIFLGKKGPQKGKDIAKTLKMSKQHLYLVLKNLQSKGIVNATLEHPARFSALPFEKVLDLFVKSKIEEAKKIQLGKNEFLSDWQSIAVGETGDRSSKFTVLEGRNYIYPKLRQMIEETKNQLLIISTVPGLIRADQFGLLETAFNHASKSKKQLRFLTELSEQNVNAFKSLLGRRHRSRFNFEWRVPELGLRLFTRMVIRDDEETVFFISPVADRVGEEDTDVCLWTNCKSLVDSFSAVFEDIWQNSTDLEKKLIEIETGQESSKTCIIRDEETGRKKYREILQSAKEEIIMMVSSKSLVEEQKNLNLLKDWAPGRLSIKIMVPIIRENLQVSRQLSTFSEVKHVSPGYPEITIIDRKHFFQFNKQLTNEKRQKAPDYFKNVLYSGEFEYVEKTRGLLNDIWRNSFAPSSITIESINKPAESVVIPLSDNEYAFSRADSPYKKTLYAISEKPRALTEEEVLNQIINAKKYPGKNWPQNIIRHYGSNAMAIIHSQGYFNLPSMMLWLLHYNKQSSFGAEDLLLVYAWLETQKGYAYVPTALITDNPKSLEFWKTDFSGTPAGENVLLVRKDELQIRMHSNFFFGSWTVAIPLLSSSYILPPSSILFEGYSKLKSGNHLEYLMPSGVKVSVDSNGMDAFVTFFHPSKKYSGPGTDGVIGRDTITTHYPPARES